MTSVAVNKDQYYQVFSVYLSKTYFFVLRAIKVSFIKYIHFVSFLPVKPYFCPHFTLLQYLIIFLFRSTFINLRKGAIIFGKVFCPILVDLGGGGANSQNKSGFTSPLGVIPGAQRSCPLLAEKKTCTLLDADHCPPLQYLTLARW